MRKSLILFAALLVLSIAVLGAAAVTVDGQSDAVSMSESTLYGDAAYAEGIELRQQIGCLNNMFWTVQLTAGAEPETKAEFVVEKRDYSDELFYDDSGINLYAPDSIDVLASHSYATELDLIAQKLAESAPNGTRTQLKIRLADYFDYYPLSIYPGNVQGEIVWEDGGEEYSYYQNLGKWRDVCKKVAEYIKIPVLKNQTIWFSVYKNDTGNIIDFTVDPYEDNADGASLAGYSANTAKRLYFTVDNKSMLGEPLDMSHIPGGYGIYSIPCEYEQKRNVTHVHFDELSTVYSLDENERVTRLHASADGESLLCLSNLESAAYLTVLDADTGKLRQRIELKGPGDQTDLWAVREQADGNLLCIGAYCAVLVEKNADGSYVQSYAVQRPVVVPGLDGAVTVRPDSSAVHEEYVMQCISEEKAVARRDGDRLIIADPLCTNASGGECGVTLLVYERGELKYAGYYASSLDAPPGDVYNYYGARCAPSGKEPLEITSCG